MNGVEVRRGIARAKERFTHRFGERGHGGVQMPDGRPGVIEVFVQRWEEPVDHTPDEARELAYDLLAAAEIAQREGAVDGDR